MHNGENLNWLDGDIEAELKKFEAEERKKLGLPTETADQWHDANPNTFTAAQRKYTTILHGGLTYAQDMFTGAAMRGIGYKFQPVEVPSNDALQYGREYGNRGQCNPTYFTVGNLIKTLTELRDNEGVSKDDLVDKYLFLTAGACGPCRFGTYVTEYRKALRDSGFDGFRVMLFEQTGGLKQATGEGVGLELNPNFFITLLRALVIGDCLNALMYRIRPYEVVPGSTNIAIDEARAVLCEAMENRTSLMKALYEVRKIMGAVKVDRTKVKPKVAIIGEFWAMTTEGDGNYKLQSFLESEGAEVEVQLVTAWILYMIWQAKYDTKSRANLRGTDEGKFGLKDVDVRKKQIMLAVAEKGLRATFQTIAHAIGLNDYHLPDMDQMAEVSHAFYDNNLRGGEGHMEVGKLILNVTKSKVNMTLSVKPFGCMPSSSVSDGVQSLITEMFPEGIFLPIETNGDGAVNVYSRVQMQLFKARQHAQRDVDRQLQAAGLTMDEVQAYLKKYPRLNHAFHKSSHVAGCTTADLVAEVGRRKNRLNTLRQKLSNLWHFRARRDAERAWLGNIAAVAAAKAKARSAVIKDSDTDQVDDVVANEHKPVGKKQLRVLN